MKNSISILIPAYNEEKNISKTISIISKYAKTYFSDYEILVFNDGSNDNTGKIINLLSKNNNKLRIFHNKKNKGLGYNFKKGILNSKKEYFTWFPGDNDVAAESVKNIFSHVGEKDLIITYLKDDSVRPIHRQLLSKWYTFGLNLLFGFNLKYYNGIVVYKRNMLKDIDVTTNSFAVLAQILIPVLKKKPTYIEYSFKTRGDKKSNMIRIKNIIGVITTITNLFLKIKFRKNKN